MKSIVKIKALAEEIIRCNEQLDRFVIFDYPASDETTSSGGEPSPINIVLEGPCAHIKIHGLSRIELDCMRSTLNSILQERKRVATEELNKQFS